MKHCVVWSGGLDSTLILYDLIKRNVDVSVITFESEVFGNSKNILEQSVRTRFLQKFSKNKIEEYTIKLDFPYTDIRNNGGLCQQPYMISLIALYGKPDTTYHFGYHKGDDFFTWHHESMNILQNINTIMNKNVQVNFPLRHMHKWQIIDRIQWNGLDDYVWFCEYPENSTNGKSACGECVPCKTHEEHSQLLKMNRQTNNFSFDLYYPENSFNAIPVQPICYDELKYDKVKDEN